MSRVLVLSLTLSSVPRQSLAGKTAVLRAAHDSPLLDDVVKFVVGLIVLQALHSVPLTFPIGLPELPNKHLEKRKGPLRLGQGPLDTFSLLQELALYDVSPQPRMCAAANSTEHQANNLSWTRTPPLMTNRDNHSQMC